MKIRHERPDADLAFRVRAPLGLELPDGGHVQITEWSLSGLTLPDDVANMPDRGVLSIPFQGVDIRFPVRLAPGDGPRDRVFDGLTGRQRETLAVFYRSLLSGRMAATGEVITALDTPVDLVPMGETEEEKAAGMAKAPPRLKRIIWNVAAYVLAAGLVFSILGGQIWTTLNTVELQNGRVVAPMRPHLAPGSGFVDRIRVDIGDPVQQGDVLIELTDPDTESTLTEVRAGIRLTERRLAEAITRRDRHLTGQAAARAEMVERGDPYGLILFDAGRSQRVGDFHDILDGLSLIVDEREAELAGLKRELSNAKDAAQALNILALEDGIVRRLDVFEDQYVARGTGLLVIEGTAPRVIMGWARETLSQVVRLDMRGKVQLVQGGMRHTVDVVVSDIVAGVDPLLPGEFGMLVTLSAPDWSTDRTRAMLRPDAPVQIVLDRDLLGLSRLDLGGRIARSWGWLTGAEA